MSEFMVW